MLWRGNEDHVVNGGPQLNRNPPSSKQQTAFLLCSKMVSTCNFFSATLRSFEVKEEAMLPNDPIFSLDALQAERKKTDTQTRLGWRSRQNKGSKGFVCHNAMHSCFETLCAGKWSFHHFEYIYLFLCYVYVCIATRWNSVLCAFCKIKAKFKGL